MWHIVMQRVIHCIGMQEGKLLPQGTRLDKSIPASTSTQGCCAGRNYHCRDYRTHFIEQLESLCQEIQGRKCTRKGEARQAFALLRGLREAPRAVHPRRSAYPPPIIPGARGAPPLEVGQLSPRSARLPCSPRDPYALSPAFLSLSSAHCPAEALHAGITLSLPHAP